MIVRTGIRRTRKFVENEKAFNCEGFFYNELFVLIFTIHPNRGLEEI